MLICIFPPAMSVRNWAYLHLSQSETGRISSSVASNDRSVFNVFMSSSVEKVSLVKSVSL